MEAKKKSFPIHNMIGYQESFFYYPWLEISPIVEDFFHLSNKRAFVYSSIINISFAMKNFFSLS